MDWSQIIVATAQHGEKFIGKTTLEELQLTDRIEDSEPVLITDARLLVSEVRFVPTPQGVGMQPIMLITQIDGADGPVDIWVSISSFYFPKNPATQTTLEGLLNSCEAAEAQKRSGLSVASMSDINRMRGSGVQ